MTGAILNPPSDTTPKDLTTTGSAPYQPTYVRDHGNALQMRPRTALRKYAIVPPIRDRADTTSEAGQHSPPYGTCLVVHITERETYCTTRDDRNEYRTTMGREEPRDTYPSPYDARNNIPRGTMPEVDVRSAPDANSQQKRDLTSLVSQLASEF